MTPTSGKPHISDWVRYPAAVVVAFLVSVTTLVLFNGLMFVFYSSSPVLGNALPMCVPLLQEFCGPLLIGFNGVFFGSICLRRCKRPFGSVLLLVLGLWFYSLFTGSTDIARGESFRFDVLFLIAIGGAAAVAWYYWRQPPNPAQPTATAPSDSTKP